MSARCYFLDVGQGTSNVILLGNRRAIVIDTGPRADVVLQVLRDYGVQEIEALIVSHNDYDHDGGVPEIWINFRNAVKTVHLLRDREKVDRIKLFSIIEDEIEADTWSGSVYRLEVNKGQIQTLWTDAVAKLSLDLISPTFMENLRARSHNETSAILVFSCDGRKIVFPADSTIKQWQRIQKRRGGQPIQCEIHAVSHHGGVVWKKQSAKKIESKLKWLYSEVIPSKHAIISVGSANTYGHPRKEVIHALKSTDTAILCTQITQQCCTNIKNLRPGVISPATASQSKPFTVLNTKDGSCDVACAGSVNADISTAQVEISRLQEHQDAVDQLNTSPHGKPMCR
jgi:competence protein ComEC